MTTLETGETTPGRHPRTAPASRARSSGQDSGSADGRRAPAPDDSRSAVELVRGDGAPPLSPRHVLSLQGLIGNAAVSRLVRPRPDPRPPSASDPDARHPDPAGGLTGPEGSDLSARAGAGSGAGGADGGGTPSGSASSGGTGGDGTPGTGGAADAAAEAGRAFGRRTEQALGLPEGFADAAAGAGAVGPAEQAGTRSEPVNRGEQGQAARGEADTTRGQMREQMTSARAAATPQPPPAPAAEAPADVISPQEAPGAVASQVEAAQAQAPVDDMTIPMDDAQGPGPASQDALGRLRGVGQELPGVVELGEAIDERVAGLRERAATNATRLAADLKGEAGTQKAAVRNAIGSSRQAVAGIIGGTRARLAQSATASRESLTQQGQEAHQRVAQAEEAETTRLTETVDRGTQDARAVFDDADAAVTEAGAREAERGRGHAHDLAEQALALGREEAQRYRREEEDEDLAEDQAEAVTDVANRFARQLRREGDTLAEDLQGQADEAREQVGEEADPTIEAVGQLGEGSAESISTMLGQVDEGVDGVVQQGQEHLGAATAGTVREIDNLDQASQSRAQAMQAEGEASVDAALAAGLVAEANLAGQAAQLADEAGRNTIGQLADATEGAGSAGGPAPGPPVQRQDAGPSDAGPTDAGLPGGVGTVPPETRDQALGQLDQMGDGLDQAADAQAGELTQSLQGAGSGASDAGGAWVSETQGQMDGLAGNADTGLAQVVDAAGGQLDAGVSDGESQATGEVDRVAGEVDNQLGQVRQSVDGGVADADRSLQDGADSGIGHADETFGELPGAMHEAAEAQDSWLGQLGNWVSEQWADTVEAIKGMCDWRFVISLAVGIVAAIAVAALVTAIILSAPFSLPALATAMIVGAAAGAAGFAAAQITGNLLDPDPNRRWYEGVGHAAIVGAFVGAAAGFLIFRCVLGYGDLRVRYGDMGDVTLSDGTVLQNVPR